MHPLHDYVAKQLADKLKDRRVVVWYDERGEFRPFVDEIRGGPRSASEPVPVAVGGTKARLAEYAASLFELRAVVEPHVSGDKPDAVVIYIPGLAHDSKASVLMELEQAGRTWKPELKQLAKNVLLQKYTLGVIDEMLPFDRKVSYEDLARAAAGNSGAEPPSILKSIFNDASGNDGLLAARLVSDARDAEIVDKEASCELTKLVKARLGLDLVADLRAEQIPSAGRYWREHTLAQMRQREVSGLQQIVRNLDAPLSYGDYPASFGVGRYLRLYALLCGVAIALRPRLAWTILTASRRWIRSSRN